MYHLPGYFHVLLEKLLIFLSFFITDPDEQSDPLLAMESVHAPVYVTIIQRHKQADFFNDEPPYEEIDYHSNDKYDENVHHIYRSNVPQTTYSVGKASAPHKEKNYGHQAKTYAEEKTKISKDYHSPAYEPTYPNRLAKELSIFHDLDYDIESYDIPKSKRVNLHKEIYYPKSLEPQLKSKVYTHTPKPQIKPAPIYNHGRDYHQLYKKQVHYPRYDNKTPKPPTSYAHSGIGSLYANKAIGDVKAEFKKGSRSFDYTLVKRPGIKVNEKDYRRTHVKKSYQHLPYYKQEIKSSPPPPALPFNQYYRTRHAKVLHNHEHEKVHHIHDISQVNTEYGAPAIGHGVHHKHVTEHVAPIHKTEKHIKTYSVKDLPPPIDSYRHGYYPHQGDFDYYDYHQLSYPYETYYEVDHPLDHKIPPNVKILEPRYKIPKSVKSPDYTDHHNLPHYTSLNLGYKRTHATHHKYIAPVSEPIKQVSSKAGNNEAISKTIFSSIFKLPRGDDKLIPEKIEVIPGYQIRKGPVGFMIHNQGFPNFNGPELIRLEIKETINKNFNDRFNSPLPFVAVSKTQKKPSRTGPKSTADQTKKEEEPRGITREMNKHPILSQSKHEHKSEEDEINDYTIKNRTTPVRNLLLPGDVTDRRDTENIVSQMVSKLKESRPALNWQQSIGNNSNDQRNMLNLTVVTDGMDVQIGTTSEENTIAHRNEPNHDFVDHKDTLSKGSEMDNLRQRENKRAKLIQLLLEGKVEGSENPNVMIKTVSSNSRPPNLPSFLPESVTKNNTRDEATNMKIKSSFVATLAERITSQKMKSKKTHQVDMNQTKSFISEINPPKFKGSKNCQCDLIPKVDPRRLFNPRFINATQIVRNLRTNSNG